MEDNFENSVMAKNVEQEETLYKMIDGERVPCTPEEAAAIRAEWAVAAAEAAKMQKIQELKSQDMTIEEKLSVLMEAVNALCSGRNPDQEIALKIKDSCDVAQKIKEFS